MSHQRQVMTFFLAILLTATLLGQERPNTRHQYEVALQEIGSDRFEEGIAGLQAVIKTDPMFPEPYRRLLETYVFTNQKEAAQLFFETRLKQNGANPYVYYVLARLDFENGRLDGALSKLQQCITLAPEYADAYSHRGGLTEVYRARKDLAGAVRFFEERVRLQPGNPCAYYGLARSHIRRYEWQQAIELLQKVLTLDPEFTLAYHSLIHIYYSTNRYDETLTASKALIGLAENLQDYEMVTYGTMMLGNAYFQMGDYLEALNHFSDALALAQKIGAKKREGICLNNMATVYALTANFSRAEKYFAAALRFAQKSGSTVSEIHALENLGNVYKDQGKGPAALEYYAQALEKAEKNDFDKEARLALSNMADIYQQRGDFETAKRHLSRALRLARQTGHKVGEAFVLRNLGMLSQDMQNDQLAIKYLQEARQIGLEAKDMQIVWESEAGLASCYQRQGHRKEAINYYARAIAIYDSVRQTLDIESLRNNFLEDKYEAYPSIVRLLGDSGNLAESFTFAEKYKAKTLLDIVSSAQNLLQTTLPDSARKALKQVARDIETAHRELSQQLDRGEQNKERALKLDQRVTRLELKQARLIATLAGDQKRYFNLTSTNVVNMAQVQQSLLRPKQALLEYILSPQAISVFLISQKKTTYLTLPIRREELLAMLTRLSPIFSQNEEIAAGDLNIFNAAMADFSVQPLQALYAALIAPIEQGLAETEELIIVPDDLLFYIPFEMLISDTSAIVNRYDFSNSQFLLERFAISYASSASLLQEGLLRERRPTAGILALGNPQLAHETAAASERLFASKSPDFSSNEQGLRPLPFAAAEVTAIGDKIRMDGNRILTGPDATESQVKQYSKDFRVIHLATHFVADDNQPLYSKIALARDSSGSEDGFLQTHEVFNLNLNADLIVLSACNTGLGHLRRGEGIVGAARAFQFAGAPSLVASLWNVSDRSTSDIMVRFYENLQAGMPQNIALQRAKLDFIRTSPEDWRDPFYWAPFILIGKHDPIPLAVAPAAIHYWTYFMLGALGIAIALWLLRRKTL